MRYVSLSPVLATFVLCACGKLEGGPPAFDGGPRADAGSLSALTWREVSPAPVARFEAVGAVVEDKLWVMGGFVSASLAVTPRIDIYDPASDTWTRGPDLRGAETHFGVIVHEGALWTIGGMLDWPPRVVDHAWRYDLRAGTWSVGPALPISRAATAVARIGDTLHVAAGLDEDGNTDTGLHYALDLDGGTTWRALAPLPNARNHLGGAAFGGTFWAIGGRHGWDEHDGHQVSTHEYNPSLDLWIERAPLPLGRSEIGASTFELGGGLVTIGGSTYGTTPTAEVLYLPAGSARWASLPPLPEPRKGAVAARIGERIIVSTGSPTSTDPSPTTWVGCCVD